MGLIVSPAIERKEDERQQMKMRIFTRVDYILILGYVEAMGT